MSRRDNYFRTLYRQLLEDGYSVHQMVAAPFGLQIDFGDTYRLHDAEGALVAFKNGSSEGIKICDMSWDAPEKDVAAIVAICQQPRSAS